MTDFRIAGTDQDNRVYQMQRQMKRWSDAKLAKELSFAQAAQDEAHQATLDWFLACIREGEQRAMAFV